MNKQPSSTVIQKPKPLNRVLHEFLNTPKPPVGKKGSQAPPGKSRVLTSVDYVQFLQEKEKKRELAEEKEKRKESRETKRLMKLKEKEEKEKRKAALVKKKRRPKYTAAGVFICLFVFICCEYTIAFV